MTTSSELQVASAGGNQQKLSFEVKEGVSPNLRWALHMASAPVDSATMTDNCRRAKKSPHVFRDLKLEPKTVDNEAIAGHTVVITNGDEVFEYLLEKFADRRLCHGDSARDSSAISECSLGASSRTRPYSSIRQ